MVKRMALMAHGETTNAKVIFHSTPHGKRPQHWRYRRR
jgi:hypothetical protein